MEPEFSKLIMKYLDKKYAVNIENNTVRLTKSLSNKLFTHPSDINQYVINVFDCDVDNAYMLTVVWLVQNGFKNVRDNWASQYNLFHDENTWNTGYNPNDNNWGVIPQPNEQWRPNQGTSIIYGEVDRSHETQTTATPTVISQIHLGDSTYTTYTTNSDFIIE